MIGMAVLLIAGIVSVASAEDPWTATIWVDASANGNLIHGYQNLWVDDMQDSSTYQFDPADPCVLLTTYVEDHGNPFSTGFYLFNGGNKFWMNFTVEEDGTVEVFTRDDVDLYHDLHVANTCPYGPGADPVSGYFDSEKRAYYWNQDGHPDNGHAHPGHASPVTMGDSYHPDYVGDVISFGLVEMVPEPVTMSLLGLGSLLMLRRRRKA